MKSVTYWYQFFTRGEELVPIIHGVKFTKCEIYGSTVHIQRTRVVHIEEKLYTISLLLNQVNF